MEPLESRSELMSSLKEYLYPFITLETIYSLIMLMLLDYSYLAISRI